MNIYTYRNKEEIRNVIIIYSSSYKSTSIININLDFIHFKYCLYVFFPLICYPSTNMFYYFLKIKHHSKLKAVSNQSLGKGMGEQHWVTSDSAQCIEMILTGLYADSLSTWYCVLLDVHCSYDTFNVFFKKMSLLHVMGLRVSL